MQNDTLRVRLLQLMQKSRKAIRLYSSVSSNRVGNNLNLHSANSGGVNTKSGMPVQGEFAEAQAQAWGTVNSNLLRGIGEALKHPQSRRVARDILVLKDQLYYDFRNGEAELKSKQRELSSAVEHGDFVRCAVTSRELVTLKARVQASQAAHHELEDVVKRCHVDRLSLLANPNNNSAVNSAAIELPEDRALFGESNDYESHSEPRGKVIPLRQARAR